MQDFEDVRGAVQELAANASEGVSLQEVEAMLLRRGRFPREISYRMCGG